MKQLHIDGLFKGFAWYIFYIRRCINTFEHDEVLRNIKGMLFWLFFGEANVFNIPNV